MKKFLEIIAMILFIYILVMFLFPLAERISKNIDERALMPYIDICEYFYPEQNLEKCVYEQKLKHYGCGARRGIR